MITIRKSKERGYANHGWLKSRHTFSFADYFDPQYMEYGVLRVINEDRIEGGTGFGAHGHRDMEIISYVVDGSLLHNDSMGTSAIIWPGDVQRMSAGSGIRHSEKNNLPDKETHFMQIWIQPEKKDIKPSYEQKSFAKDFGKNELILVVSRNGKNGSITINQDINMYVAKTEVAGEYEMKNLELRFVWIQVIKGEVDIAGEKIISGDGAAIENIDLLKLQWSTNSEFLVFDLPNLNIKIA